EDEPGDNIGFPADHGGTVFKKEMRILVRELYRTLLAFKEAVEKKSQPPIAQPQPDGDQAFTVFLADTSEDLGRTIRRRLITELREKKIQLAEFVPPPMESEPHDQKAIQEIKRAHLSLHLFDASPGRDIEDAPDRFYTHRQVELGKQHARSQMIWLPNSITYDS